MNTILIILGLVVLVVVLILVFNKKKPVIITTTTTKVIVETTTTMSPPYNNYTANVYVCGTCVQANEPGYGDPVKSTSSLVVGYFYNGGDGFIYEIINSYGDPTTIIIPGNMHDVSCKGASAYGC